MSAFIELMKVSFNSKVHYPEDRKYTIKPLPVTHLAGRDPVTGRVVCNRSCFDAHLQRHSS